MCETKASISTVVPVVADSVAPASGNATPVENVDTKAPEVATTPAETTPVASTLAVPSTIKIFFAPDSSLLQPDAQELAALTSIVDYMKSNKSAAASVTGFTTSLGATTADELAVGQARAESAKAYLVSRGISNDRITTDSKGANGVDDSGNPVDQTANRRAEITVKANN
jgi:outer membrane protein OmpA-like peptidoglycan-associated protein